MSDLATVGLPFLRDVEKKFYVHCTCGPREHGQPRCGFLYLAAHLLSRAAVELELPDLKRGIEQLCRNLTEALEWLDESPAPAIKNVWLGKGYSIARAMRAGVRNTLPRMMDTHLSRTKACGPDTDVGKELRKAFDKVSKHCDVILKRDVSLRNKAREIAVDFARAGDLLDDFARLLEGVFAKDFGDHISQVRDVHLKPSLFKAIAKHAFVEKLHSRIGEVVMTSEIWDDAFLKVFQ